MAIPALNALIKAGLYEPSFFLHTYTKCHVHPGLECCHVFAISFQGSHLRERYLYPAAACALPGAPVLMPVLLLLGTTCSQMSWFICNLSRGKQGIREFCRAMVPCISSWLELPWLAAPSRACEEGDWDWKVFKVSTIYSEQEEKVWPFSNGKLCQCSHWDFPPGDCLNVTCGKPGHWKHFPFSFVRQHKEILISHKTENLLCFPKAENIREVNSNVFFISSLFCKSHTSWRCLFLQQWKNPSCIATINTAAITQWHTFLVFID